MVRTFGRDRSLVRCAVLREEQLHHQDDPGDRNEQQKDKDDDGRGRAQKCFRLMESEDTRGYRPSRSEAPLAGASLEKVGDRRSSSLGRAGRLTFKTLGH